MSEFDHFASDHGHASNGAFGNRGFFRRFFTFRGGFFLGAFFFFVATLIAFFAFKAFANPASAQQHSHALSHGHAHQVALSAHCSHSHLC